MVINAFDEIVGIDRDEGGLVFLDANGRHLGSRGGKDLKDAKDLAFDAFGHLYVLTPKTIMVFSPYHAALPTPATAAPSRGTGPAPVANRGDEYTLRISFSEPEKAPGFHQAAAFTVDRAGNIFLYDESAKQILVYR
jgi:hypothetical protein